MNSSIQAHLLAVQTELQITKEDRDQLRRDLDALNAGTEAQLRKEIADLQEINRGLELQLCQLPALSQRDDYERLQNDNSNLRGELSRLQDALRGRNRACIDKDDEIQALR